MMGHIKETLSIDRTFCNYTAENKKALLHDVCVSFTKYLPAGLTELDLLDKFMKRERLGTTAIGSKIAIPHVRIENLNAPLSAFFKLANPIAFDAPDNLDVDLIFAMIVPDSNANQHLQILSEISQTLSIDKTRDSLRLTTSPIELFNQLVNASHELTS